MYNNKAIVWIFSLTGIGLILVLMGVHNVDTAYNMNIKDIDIGVFGEQRSKLALYSAGLIEIILSLIFFFLSNVISIILIPEK